MIETVPLYHLVPLPRPVSGSRSLFGVLKLPFLRHPGTLFTRSEGEENVKPKGSGDRDSRVPVFWIPIDGFRPWRQEN